MFSHTIVCIHFTQPHSITHSLYEPLFALWPCCPTIWKGFHTAKMQLQTPPWSTTG